MVQQIVIPAPGYTPVLPQQATTGQPSFVQRLLQFTVTLAPTPGNPQPATYPQPSTFAGANTFTFQNARSSAQIKQAGSPQGSTADIAIYGLDGGLMNALSSLNRVYNQIGFNTVQVSAGNTAGGFTPVFSGTVQFSAADYNQQPDVPLRLICQSGQAYSVISATPTSYQGNTNVADVMSGLARLMNVEFENNGVTSKINNPYYPGTAMQQVQQLAAHAHIHAELVDGDTKLAIWPIGGARTSTSVPTLTPTTGIIGYPTFSPNGYMYLRHIFNPQVSFGGQLVVSGSSIQQANRTWNIYGLDLTLDSLVPLGRWEAVAACFPAGYAAPPPGQPLGTP